MKTKKKKLNFSFDILNGVFGIFINTYRTKTENKFS